MEDYFALAGYNSLAKGIMGRAKLEGPAKLWRKLNCESRGISEYNQGWEDLKERLRERYLPLNYSTIKMNEFLSCTRKGMTIEKYHEEFVKLSRHAPLMSEEQKLSRFILGLEGKLADKVESLRPTSLADALIRAKSKLSSFTRVNFTEGRKRNPPSYPPPTFRPTKAPFVSNPEQDKGPAVFRPPVSVNNVQAKALPVTQSGKHVQCFECKEWGHKKVRCPNKRIPFRSPLTPQRKAFLNQNQGGQNRQGNGKPLKNSTVNHVTITEEVEEQAHIYVALDLKR